MNRLPTERRVIVLKCLCEGMSIRSTTRISGASAHTVMNLLVEAGRIANAYQDAKLVDLPCKRLQVDETWAFIYAKEKHVLGAKNPPEDAGDVWTWTVICDHTKLLASWRVGDRTSETALELLDELAKRIEHRIQLTSDGLSAYLEAVEGAYGGDIDYAQLIKHYGGDPLDADRSAKARYSPGECTGTHVIHVSGRPDLSTIGTSYVERSNLTVRMSLRRYTRLTNAFSKKIENHTASFSVYAFWYNWIRPHMSLRTKRNNQITPAMAAGLTDRPMSFEDLVGMIDADYEARRPKTRGPYRPRKLK